MRQVADEVVLITGSTSGIGLATAEAVGRAGAKVIVHGSDAERVDRARASLQAAGVPVAGAIAADLRSREQVEDLATRAAELAPTAVVNNAGVYMRTREETAEGREVTWTVNHLHPSLLTVLLLDDLLDRGGRVVNVSAVVHSRARMNLDDPEFRDRNYSHFHAYANSKLANLLMARQWARRVGAQGPVTFSALHPGVVSTKLLTEGMRVEGHDEAAVAGSAVAALAIDPAFGAVSGQYFEGTTPTTPSGPGTDDVLGAQLYERTLADLGFA